VLISPSKLYRKRKLNKKLFNEILNSTRDPEEREGDFNAQVGALELGEKRLSETISKYTLNKIKQAGNELLDYSERIMKKVIKDIPDGVYDFEDYMDNDGAGTTKIPIKVKITIKGKRATVDLRGSSPNVRGNLNAPYSVTTAAVIYVFQCLAPSNMPLNSGPLRAVDILVDEDSMLNAKYPAAVVGGNVETSQRIVDVVFGALSKAVPEKVPAASAGSMSNFTFGGINPKTGGDYGYYETIAGGMGARYGMDGVCAVQTHMTNTLNTPIESLERELPVMINTYSIRKNSGGKGKYHGGDSIIREYKFLSKATVSIITERRKFAPYGIEGGSSGRKGVNTLLTGRNKSKIEPKATFNLKKGDSIRIETPGGGGWGKNS
jgi:N-methylhydantoinase B/oxoprolinase/acetone carboxylase alpha subunit